jgi:uncharacterized repeat protein (TIGR03803 family)
MTRQQRFAALILDTNRRTRITRLLFAVVFGTTVFAQAQTYTVLHYFTGGGDGSEPVAGLTLAGAGNFYGATAYGGSAGSGTVFNLRQAGSGWILTTLYNYQGGYDGAEPEAPPAIGPDGSLYGTTYEGGPSGCVIGCGTVYKLTPPANSCRSASCPWTKTVVHSFQSSSRTDGAFPGYGKLIFDQAGNLYGTTSGGGANGFGTVFELIPSNGSWTETILYSFSSIEDGYLPYSSVIFDSVGNLFGTTQNGGPNSNGTVYELSPTGSGWTKSILLSSMAGAKAGAPRVAWSWTRKAIFTAAQFQAGEPPTDCHCPTASGTIRCSRAFPRPSRDPWTLRPSTPQEMYI